MKKKKLKIPRRIFKDGTLENVPAGAIALYVWLKEYEYRKTNDVIKKFHVSDKRLSESMGVTENTIVKYRKKLIDAGLIRFSREHITNEYGEKSSERYGCYVMEDDVNDTCHN